VRDDFYRLELQAVMISMLVRRGSMAATLSLPPCFPTTGTIRPVLLIAQSSLSQALIIFRGTVCLPIWGLLTTEDLCQCHSRPAVLLRPLLHRDHAPRIKPPQPLNKLCGDSTFHGPKIWGNLVNPG
jgi:hypothetical protein